MNKATVADIMTRNPISVNSNSTLLDCAKLMIKNKVGSLLIVEGKRLIGLITERDILWAIVKKSCNDLSKIKALDISPRKIATIQPMKTIEETIKKMKKVKFSRLPVIHEGALVGMVTMKDILTFNPEFYPELEELAKIREESNKLQRIKKIQKTMVRDGICEECGKRGSLHRFNGMLVCDSCMEE